jgi:hypothetical protein
MTERKLDLRVYEGSVSAPEHRELRQAVRAAAVRGEVTLLTESGQVIAAIVPPDRILPGPARRHEIIPLPGSVRDHGDVPVTTRGTRPEQYPITAVCSECQEGAYCADITADWCHLDDAVRHMVQLKVISDLARYGAGEVGVTSPEIARRITQPPCAVRRALAVLENRGAAWYVRSGGNENMIQWFLTPGGNPSARQKILRVLEPASDHGLVASGVARYTGLPLETVQQELATMRDDGLVRPMHYDERHSNPRWVATTGGNQL